MNDYEAPKTRPVIITIFGVLTFVACGFTILGSLMNFINTDSLRISGMPIYIPMVTILLCGGKIFGVIEMFKMKRSGFFIYTISEVAAFLLTIISIKYTIRTLEVMPGFNDIPMDIGSMVTVTTIVSGIIFSGLWIGVYASQLNKMT